MEDGQSFKEKTFEKYKPQDSLGEFYGMQVSTRVLAFQGSKFWALQQENVDKFINALKLMHYCLTFHFRSAEVIPPLFCFELLDYS